MPTESTYRLFSLLLFLLLFAMQGYFMVKVQHSGDQLDLFGVCCPSPSCFGAFPRNSI